jgi:dTDP-4-dehydrorhamnose 3,5-epimerase
MIFVETPIAGAYVIEPERREDDRGFFARIFCRNEFAQHGLKTEMMQANTGFSRRKGTLRGLHFQRAPHAEVKVVRCTSGSMHDVIVDLRPDSPTWKQWFGVELSQQNRKMLYVPEGCAQGYITLADDTEMYYLASEFYSPETASGVRFDDPQFGIQWPAAMTVISKQDREWPDYSIQD